VKRFNHLNAYTIDEASALLESYGDRACIIAGGTDVLGKMKDLILPKYPEALINLKTIPDMDCIKESHGAVSIGALTTLAVIAENTTIKKNFSALADAAGKTASPNIRTMGTLGGNICQDIRCWYYRNQLNRFNCLRKGGGRCYAIKGDNRFHSIFGGSVSGGCFAVHQSDTAPALVALNATIKTNRRSIEAEKFFEVKFTNTTVLDQGEIITSIELPALNKDSSSAFLKYALRKSIDFPIVNCAVMLSKSGTNLTSARICLNAVAVVPRRVEASEKLIIGKAMTPALAEEAGAAAVADAKPMEHNDYMVQAARTLVKRAILAACGIGE
jgi:xanthine dehydrogenase YagS FAD-binding subunit